MIFYQTVGWHPEKEEATLARYPQALIFSQPRDEELLRYNTPKEDRQLANCTYLLHAIYTNAANRRPTHEELNANLNSLRLEPSIKELIAQLETGWRQLQTFVIQRLGIQTSYEATEKRVRLEFGEWSFSCAYDYDDGMICLCLEQMQHPTLGVLLRDRSRAYNEDFDLAPALLAKLRELLIDKSVGVEDLPEIQEYLRQIRSQYATDDEDE